MNNNQLNLSLYVVTDPFLSGSLPLRAMVEQAISGGAVCIQLRDKKSSSGELFNTAIELIGVTKKHHVPLIINDRLDIALAIKADGVHLGQEDIPAQAARRIMPPEMILGVSVDSVPQALEAQEAGASYLGVGSIFATATKPDAGYPIGLNTLSEICLHVDIPVVGIGGIHADNAGLVIKAGAQGVAVVSCVVGADDVPRAAEKVAAAVSKALMKT